MPPLAKLKWYVRQRQFRNCLQLSQTLVTQQELQLWVAHIHLSCLREYFANTQGKQTAEVMTYFDKLKPVKNLLLQSPYEFHRRNLLESFLEVADRALLYRKDLASGFINQHHQLVDYMVDGQRSRYYRMLGEMAWQSKEKELAVQNYWRSYQFSPSDLVRQKLEELQAGHLLAEAQWDESLIYSDGENQLWGEFTVARQLKNHQTLAKVGVQYLAKYPGSQRATDVAAELLNSLQLVVYQQKLEFKAIRDDVLGTLRKAPVKFILPWLRSIYGRGYYAETLILAEQAVELLAESGEASEPLLMAGKAAYFLADWQKSEKYLRQLIDQYRGQDPSNEAQYYLGLLFYRRGDFQAVITLYEKFLLTKDVALWELQVRYWLWHALRKVGSEREGEQATIIMKKFPLTYYGLLVRGEKEKNLQSLFAGELPDVSVKYWWTPDTKARWTRINGLLTYGWVEEAEKEIDLLPSPVTPEGYLLQAQLWSAANRSMRAMMAISKAVDMRPEFLTKDVLKLAFPREFIRSIDNWAAKREIDRDLVLAVIRQESGFVADAVSTSNAIGLMQLVRVTANETAKWLKVNGFQWPDSLVQPDLNVQFGSHYIQRMIRKYEGVVPLAMAAYNVGPGNMDRWLGQRKDLEQWAEIGKNEIDDMWMDELPWGETSFYVKAILRNYLLYKIIFDGKEAVATPVWSDAQSFVPSRKDR